MRSRPTPGDKESLEASMRLVDKTALVTGGGTGIGAATARTLVEEGARVCVMGRRRDPLTKVVAGLPSGSAIAHQGDVSRVEEVAAAVRETVEFGNGRLDVVVNNAGIGPEGTVEDGDLDDWSRTLEINLTGPMLVMRAAIPHLRRSGGGAIVNISSASGRRPFPGLAAYCVSKAGLIMLTQQAAIDLGGDHIRVNTICPGWVRTPMSENDMNTVIAIHGGDTESAFATVSRDTPLTRVAMPTEIASIVSFLASDDASFISGAVIAADGGSTVVDVSTLAFIDRRQAGA
jgi:NAD(P)-dependent dehydrogenase (short-subunit alcohol dehydrogenase family)